MMDATTMSEPRSVRKHKDNGSFSEENMTDLDLDSNIHDQLPHVESVKSSHSTAYTKFWRRVIVIGVAGIVVLAAILIPLGVKRSKNNNSSSEPVQGMEVVQNFLLDYVDHDALADVDSPQYRAAVWISEEDGLQLPIKPDSERFLQRYALAVLYYATQGDQWVNTLNFLTVRNECNWHDRLMRSDTEEIIDMGVYCDDNNNVEQIRLQALALSGTLPKELKYFPKLIELGVDGNSIVGDIPRLHDLEKLTTLTATHNELTGPLPNWMSLMTSLRNLGLSNNDFRGTIPENWETLTRLRVLGLDDNDLNGALDPLMKLTSLEKLYLDNNAFTGQIDNGSFMTDLRSLKVLDISKNQLKGTLPRELIRLADLEILDLSSNMLAGIADNLGRTQSLKFLSLHSNLLMGSIPRTIQNMENLEHLDLSSNKLVGTIHEDIGKLKNLTYLFLADNKFLDKAPVPAFLRNLTKLEELSLKHTERTGTIPAWLDKLDKLVLLDLDGNHFNSSIPSELGKLQYLKFLLLNRNNLTGELPDELGNIPELIMLMINNNTISGNADAVCHAEHQLQFFVSDCGGDTPEIECPDDCCTECCDDEVKCRDQDLLANYDPSWENGYRRDDFNFADDVTFSKVRDQ